MSSAVGPPVLANDIDPDNDPLMALLVSNPTNGILTLNPTGTFAYTPNPNFHGVDSFTYRASDGTLSSNVATVIIQVVSVNDAPVAVNDSYSLSEDTQLNVIAPGVLGNDSDVDGNTLSAILVTGPANGSLTLNADGSFTYTPNLNFHGTDAFTYRTSDGALASNVATVTINVVSVNDAPIAVFDAFQTAEGAFDTIFGNLLLNDSDADGDPLNVTDPCLDLNVNTAGVTGDVAAKLPGLATQLIDPSLLDGTPCLWGISTATGQTFVALTADGTLSDGPTTGSPFQGLETGDSLDFLSTYSVSDGMGAISTGTFLVQIVGAS